MSHDNSLPVPKRSIATTVELPVFLNIIAVSLAAPALSNIILYRTCVHSLNYAEDHCSPYLSPIKSNETSDIEHEVQKYSTYVSTVKVVLKYIFPAFLALFLGGWSDTYGRKPLIVWPLFGMSISTFLMVIFSMMDSLGPWWYILTAVPFSMTGGFVVFFTGTYCFVSDTSSPSNTALRMTLVDTTMSLGSVVGAVGSTYLIQTIGNTYLLLLSAAISVTSYAFTNIYIMESLTGALQNGFIRIFDFLLVKEMFSECLKERPNHGRAQILLLSLNGFLMIMIVLGISGLEYLYTRQLLHWSLREYTTYSSVSTCISFVASILGVIVIQKVLRISDMVFAIFAIMTATADSLIKLFANQTWHMYLGSTISMFKGLTGAFIRSFLTKTLPQEDIAKVFALMSAIDSFGPIIAPIMFNSLYALTLVSFPGAIYLLSSLMFGTCIILLGLVQYFSWKGRSNYSTFENAIDT